MKKLAIFVLSVLALLAIAIPASAWFGLGFGGLGLGWGLGWGGLWNGLWGGLGCGLGCGCGFGGCGFGPWW